MDKDAGKIFVGGLSWQTTEESLRFHFEQFGPVLSVDLMRDRNTGDPRGFAFVVFSDPATVDVVMAEPRHEVNHKVVDVKRAQARGQAPPSIHGGQTVREAQPYSGGEGPSASDQATGQDFSPEEAQCKIFVGGIPTHVDNQGLEEAFKGFGPVVDAIVMLDNTTKRSRGFGFVTFEPSSDGAQAAVAAQPIYMSGKKVEIKLATPRGQQENKRPIPTAPSRNLGLRAGLSTSTGEFAGLAVAYGRSGWKAGFGSKAFGAAGWKVEGWDDGGAAPSRAGFSFDLVQSSNERPTKRQKQ